MLGNAVYQYQSFFKVAVPDAFLCLKFWLALYVGKNVLSRFSIRRYAKKIYNHVRFVTAVYVICYFFDLKFHLFKASIRYGMRCTQLMYPVAIPIALWLGVIMNQDTFDVEGGNHPNR